MPDWRELRVCRPARLAVLAAVAGLGWLGLAPAPASAQGMGQAALNASLQSKNHCSLIQSSPYEDTVGCLVWDRKPFGDSEARQIEIYRKGELKLTIEPGDPIREWHFWENGRRMEVAYGAPGAAARYALYDLAIGKQVDGAVLGMGMAGAGGTALPQWTKSLSQLQDESVPEGVGDKQARMLWMAKVLRGLDGVKVGMRRKDLAPLLAQQGGLSKRTERTYVSLECPYIKVDLKFKAVGDGAFESPEDVVVEVSKAYLGWGVMD